MGTFFKANARPGCTPFPLLLPPRGWTSSASARARFSGKHLSTPRTIKVLGETYWDGFPVPAIPPLEEPTSGPDPSSETDMDLRGPGQRWRRSRHSIHQTYGGSSGGSGGKMTWLMGKLMEDLPSNGQSLYPLSPDQPYRGFPRTLDHQSSAVRASVRVSIAINQDPPSAPIKPR